MVLPYVARGVYNGVTSKKKKMAPKISIVIPCYNAERFIEETLLSVLNQDYSNFQCFVVDGQSDDSTLDILKKYEGRIRWISEKDKGQSDAINKGLKMSDGDIVTYLNADDVYEPGCFQRVADFFAINPECHWAYGKCRIIDEKGMEIRKPITWYKNFWQRRYSYNRLLVTLNFIAQPAVFWRRELTEAIGLFDVDEHLTMDYDYWLRAGLRYQPGFIDEYLARFRLHPVSKSATSFVTSASAALRKARKYAILQKRGYLIPLQYLSYFLVVVTYSLLKLVSLKR